MLVALKSALLSAALSLAPSQPGEPQEDYRSRLAVIVDAIGEEAKGREEAFAVLSVLYHESRFRRDVHAGRKLGDGDRAICLSQQHRNGRSEADWRALAGVGPEATRRCVRASVVALRRARGWCRARSQLDGWRSVFALYGSGMSCRAPVGVSRERTMLRLLGRF